MKGSRRIFKSQSLQHVYQNTYNSGVIFYTIADRLVFFSIFCTFAKLMKVRIMGLCMMINHIHFHAITDNKQTLSAFVKRYTATFVKLYNKNKGRVGSLFKPNFGSSSKKTPKEIMTSIAYLGNNPVLKKLCSKVEEYRWGFIPYAKSKNPFSNPLDEKNCSRDMKQSLALIRSYARNNQYLNYNTLEKIFTGLSNDEKRQLIDYIIETYNVIEYDEMIKFYGSYETMIIAVNSNSGNEYDIKEDWDNDSDRPFSKMISICKRMGYGGEKGFNFQKNSDYELKKLAQAFNREANAGELHIAKFLHINIQRVKTLISEGDRRQ